MMVRRRLTLLSALAAGGLAAAVADAGAPPSTRPGVPVARATALTHGPHPDRQIELLGRKIGQMLVIGFPGSRPDEEWPRRAAAMIGDGRIGGVILFAQNVVSPAQLGALTAPLVEAGGALPPLIAVDQEGGSIQRLTRRKGFHTLPSARTMATKPLCEAHQLYLQTAMELAAARININLGPVVDLDVNPASPAIGGKARSFGRDSETVVAYARQFIAAHAEAGILTLAKHFPGHGSARGDPHTQIVDISATWDAAELQPFRELTGEHGVGMIMVGHLIHPRFSDGDRPASLSRRTLTEELRKGLGYDGLIVTDDLGMEAITGRYSAAEAAEMAIRAGADLLIFANQPSANTPTVEAIIAAVAGAVAAGRLPESGIDASSERIRAARRALARHRPLAAAEAPQPCPEPGAADAGAKPSNAAAARLDAAGVTPP
jgi:beta-N-acetylhexosaminidase